MLKRFIISCLVLIVIGGCSYAHIKNKIGGPEGLTYTKHESTSPVKTLTITKINGKLQIIKK